MGEKESAKREPGVCIPWTEKLKEIPQITGDKELVERIWKENDGLGYIYVWHCLVSF